MRILLVVPEFPPYHIGGGGIVFEALAREYVRAGHDVLVVAGDYRRTDDMPVERYRENGYDVLKVREYHTSLAFLRTVLPPFFRAYVPLWRALRSFRPDVAHVHGYGHLFVDILARMCRVQNIPFVFTNHGFPVVPYSISFPIPYIWDMYRFFVAEFLHRRASAITAVSGYTASMYTSRYAPLVHVIGNGIAPTLIRSAPAVPYAERKGILSVGRIAEYKGFHDVVRVLSRVPSLEYTIVGADGGYANEVMRIAESCGVRDRVHCVGRKEQSEIATLCAHAYAVVVPSHIESFGLVALEGLAQKTPVITTGVQGLAFLKKSRNAYFYSSDDALVAYLTALPEYTEETFVDAYVWARVAEAYLTLLSHHAR